MRRLRSRRLLIPLILALAAAPVLGQQPSVSPRCVIFPIQDLSSGEETRDYQQTITEAVAAAASARGFTVLPESNWKAAAEANAITTDQPDTQTMLRIGRLVGADFALAGTFTVENDEIYYSIQCWNVATGSLAMGIQETTPFNLALFSALSLTLTNDLLPSVQLKQSSAPRVTFTSPDEDMEVLLSGDMNIGRIAGGRVSWPLGSVAPGTKVVVEKRKPGFHTARQTVTMRTDRDIPLSPLARSHTGAVELDATLGQLLGMGAAARGYIIPDWLFVTLGNYAWVQPPVTLAARAVLHDDLWTGVSGYLFLPPGAPVRLGVSSGAGIIFTHFTTDGFPIYRDFYLNVASLWVEAGFPGTTFYVRGDFRYGLGIDTCLLGQGWWMDDGPSMTLGVILR